MYMVAAAARRRCTGRRKDGGPCRAWAVWDDPRQQCVAHAGRHHRSPLLPGRREGRPARYIPCARAAYTYPPRPGGGLFRWPDAPIYRRTTPAGTHGTPRLRKAWLVPIRAAARRQHPGRWWEEQPAE